jgi:hypothetical protein
MSLHNINRRLDQIERRTPAGMLEPIQFIELCGVRPGPVHPGPPVPADDRTTIVRLLPLEGSNAKPA